MENLEKILIELPKKDLIDIIQMSEEIYKSKEEIKYDLIEQTTLSFDEAEITLRNTF